jgi:hypothetical protein
MKLAEANSLHTVGDLQVQERAVGGTFGPSAVLILLHKEVYT